MWTNRARKSDEPTGAVYRHPLRPVVFLISMSLAIITDYGVGIVTLTALEIVLGIDNIVLLSILVEKLPESQQNSARKIGLALALIARLLFLTIAVWLTSLTEPLFSLFGTEISARSLILIIGGLFLLGKATSEIFSIC